MVIPIPQAQALCKEFRTTILKLEEDAYSSKGFGCRHLDEKYYRGTDYYLEEANAADSIINIIEDDW